MFRIVCLVKDDKLGVVMRALAGVAFNVQHQLVADIEDTPKVSPGDAVDLLIKYMKKKDLKQITASGARDFQRSIGRSPDSYNHTLKLAIKAGFLKKVRTNNNKGMFYTIVERKK